MDISLQSIKDQNTSRSLTDILNINHALEEENITLKKQIRHIETESKKQIALLEQKLDLKNQEFNELKESQNQLKKMNETIMCVVSDLNRTSSTQPFVNKAIKELEIATQQHNKEMIDLRARTNEAIKNYELEIKKLKEDLCESEHKCKELYLNEQKEKLQYIQRIKELETQQISIEFYNKRYEDEKSRNRDYEQVNHDLLIKYNEIKNELERVKNDHSNQVNVIIHDYERKLQESKYHNKEISKEDNKDSNREATKDFNTDFNRDNKKDSTRDFNKDTNRSGFKELNREANIEINKDADKEPHRDANTSTYKEVIMDLSKEFNKDMHEKNFVDNETNNVEHATIEAIKDKQRTTRSLNMNDDNENEINKHIENMKTQHAKEIMELKTTRDQATEKVQRLESNLYKIKSAFKDNETLHYQNSKILKERIDALIDSMDHDKGIIQENQYYKEQINLLKMQVCQIQESLNKMQMLSSEKQLSIIFDSLKKSHMNKSISSSNGVSVGGGIDLNEEITIEQENQAQSKNIVNTGAQIKNSMMKCLKDDSQCKNQFMEEMNPSIYLDIEEKKDHDYKAKPNTLTPSKINYALETPSKVHETTINPLISEKSLIINETNTERVLAHIQEDFYSEESKSSTFSKEVELCKRKKSQLRNNSWGNIHNEKDLTAEVLQYHKKASSNSDIIMLNNNSSSYSTMDNTIRKTNNLNSTNTSQGNELTIQGNLMNFQNITNPSKTQSLKEGEANTEEKSKVQVKSINITSSEKEQTPAKSSFENPSNSPLISGKIIDENDEPKAILSSEDFLFKKDKKEYEIDKKEMMVDKKKIYMENMPITYSDFVKKSERLKWIKADPNNNNNNTSTLETHFGETVDLENLLGDTFKYTQNEKDGNDHNNISLGVDEYVNEMKSVNKDEINGSNFLMNTNLLNYSKTHREEEEEPEIEQRYSFFANQLIENMIKQPMIPNDRFNSSLGRETIYEESQSQSQSNTKDKFSGDYDRLFEQKLDKWSMPKGDNNNNQLKFGINNTLNETNSSKQKSSLEESNTKSNSSNETKSKIYENSNKYKEINCKIKALELKNEGTKIQKEKVQLEIEKLKLELEVARLEQEAKHNHQCHYNNIPIKASSRYPLENSQQTNLTINYSDYNQQQHYHNLGTHTNSTFDRGANKVNTFHDKENTFYDKENAFHGKENVFHSKENGLYGKDNGFHDKEDAFHDKENVLHGKENVLHDKENTFYRKESIFHDKENAYKTEIKSLINNLLKTRNKLEKHSDESSLTRNISLGLSQVPIQHTTSMNSSIPIKHKQTRESFNTLNNSNNFLPSQKNCGSLNLSSIHYKGNSISNNFSNSTTRSQSPFSMQLNSVTSSININSNTNNNCMNNHGLRLSHQHHQSINQHSLSCLADHDKDELMEQKPLNKNKASLNQAIENFSKNINRSKSRSRSNLRPSDNNHSNMGSSSLANTFHNNNHTSSIDGNNNNSVNLNQSTMRSSRRTKSPNTQQKMIFQQIGTPNVVLNKDYMKNNNMVAWSGFDKQNQKNSSFTISKRLMN